MNMLRDLDRRLDVLIGDWFADGLAEPAVTKEIIPRAEALGLVTAYNTKSLPPYIDKAGVAFPNDEIGQIITSANMFLKRCNQGRAFKTYLRDGTRKVGAIPRGLHLFEAPKLPPDLSQSALSSR